MAKKDLEGLKFNNLTATNNIKKRHSKSVRQCYCDCGNEIWVESGRLITGRIKSCGCYKIPLEKRVNFVDLSGKTFRKWTVISVSNKRSNTGSVFWHCKCECGTLRDVNSRTLINGQSKSCGCLRIESATKLCKSRVGDKRPNWKNARWDDMRARQRRYFGYDQWRKDIYSRDNYTCQVCLDSSKKRLEAHHLYSYSTHEELRTVLENGVTVCRCCHTLFHKKYGKGNNTKEQFKEFSESYYIG